MFLFDSLVEETIPKTKFRQEVEEGNVEYKLRLDQKNESSLKKMKNQMNWRFEEGKELTGKRECHYILGIRDDGRLGGLTEDEINITLDIFKNIIEGNDASFSFCEKKRFDDDWIVFISLGKMPQKKITEMNIGFVGHSQTGKTTTISNIVYGQLDDGIGTSRVHVFKHEHERLSGVTSSIKKEIVGVKNGRIVNYNTGINTSWDQIAGMSERILSLIDLPGSSQYIKTILFGLATYNFDALVIFNDKNSTDENNLNKLYIEYADVLKIPYIVVEIDDIITPTSLSSFQVGQFKTGQLYPSGSELIYSSSVNTGTEELDIHNITNLKPNGINCIISFLLNVKKRSSYSDSIKENIFVIYDIVPIPETGIIFSGEMWYGKLSVDNNVFLTNGDLTFNLKVQSIHKKQIFAQNIDTGEMGAILLSGSNMEIQKHSKHMIITTEQLQSRNHIIFESKTLCTISKNDEITVYINNDILKGFIKEIHDKNHDSVKYTMILRKNAIIVPRNKNIGFAKIRANIFIIKIML